MKKLVMTSSSIGTLQHCAKAYKLKHVDLIESAHKPQYLTIGSAFHAALELFRSGAKTVAELRSALMPYADRLDSNGLCVLTAMVEAYWKKYARNRETFDKVEMEWGSYESIYQENDAYISGVVDALDAGGRIWETKTVSRIDGSYLEALWSARQTLMYAAYLMRAGVEVTGVVYDIVQKPTIGRLLATPVEKRRYVKDKETGEMRLHAKQREADEPDAVFLNRLRKWYDDHPEALHREEIFYTQAQLDLVRHDVRAEAKRLMWHTGTGEWPRSLNACYRGNGKCEFAALCGSGESSLILDAHYKKKEKQHPELGGLVQ
jgi:hypothetical protein